MVWRKSLCLMGRRFREARLHDLAYMTEPVLIRDASLIDGRRVDLRLAGGRIAEVTPANGSREGYDARGGLLLPALHDHHIHVLALAASIASVRCGPPDVGTGEELAIALRQPGTGWLRGISYHESVVGLIDRDWLDAVVPDRPVRIQHRSGRLWVFNSAGLDAILDNDRPPPPGLERVEARWTGRLYDEDVWLRQALRGAMPALDAVGAMLARYGIAGATEISPANDATTAAHFAHERARGAFPQAVVMAGTLGLGEAPLPAGIALGPVKLHLHEATLPDFDQTVSLMRAAHEQGRVVAVHCVTETELGFTLAALNEAGVRAGDRIEHASVTTPEQLAEIAAMDLTVVAQPNFVGERGDAYLAAIPKPDWPFLYRLRSFADAGVTLAGGCDAPFGNPDPWAAMAAAVSRRTMDGAVLGGGEALSPEDALALFLADPDNLGQRRAIRAGAPADLCLLDAPWAVARDVLSADLVRATWIDGRLVHDRIDQAPV